MGPEVLAQRVKFGKWRMRIVRAVGWGLLVAFAGALNLVAFAYVFGWPLAQSALIGAVLAGSVGAVYEFFRQRSPRSSSEARQSAANFNIESCAWCGGTGKEGKKQKTCSVCRGQGSLLTAYPHERCSNCKGKGRVFLGRRCKVCRGAGWENYAHLDGASIKRRRGRTRVAV